MNRRQFIKSSAAAAAALSPSFLRAESKPPLFSKLGVAASLSRASELKAAGAEYVEDSVGRLLMPEKSDAEFAASVELAKSAPLPALACNGFLPSSHRATGPDADHAKVLAYARVAFKRAEKLGVKTIVFGSAGSRRLPDGFDRSEALKQFVSLLKQMGPLAGGHGIVVGVEPLNRQECNFLNTIVQGAEIVAAVDHPSIRLTADIFHMMRNEESPQDLIATGRYVAHAHIAEKEKRSAPGVAGDDFAPYFAALRRAGYSGPLSIEASNWSIEELAVAFSTIRRQAAAV